MGRGKAMLFFPHNPAPNDGYFPPRNRGDTFRIELMLCGVNALVQAFCGVIIQNRHGLLADDRAGIHTRIHEMNRAASHFDAVIERLFPGFKTGKGGQQGRMDIHDTTFEGAQKIALQDTHEASQDHQIHLGGLQGADKRALGVFIKLGAEFPRRNELGRELSFAGMRQDSGSLHVAGYKGNLRRDFAGGKGIGNGDKV